MEVQVKLFPDMAPAAVPVLAPGDSVSPACIDGNDFLCWYGHSTKTLLNVATKALGVKLRGELKPYTGCPMVLGYREPIGSRTRPREDKNIGRVFGYLSGPKSMSSLTGKRYVIIIKEIICVALGCTISLEHLNPGNSSRRFLLMCVLMVLPP